MHSSQKPYSFASKSNRESLPSLDKLDGKIEGAFSEGKAREWREEQNRIQHTIEEHQDANQSYLDEGIRILELSQRAHELFQKQESREKRRLLNFLLSNCTWKNGELEVIYRQPFDMIAEMKREHEKKKATHLPKSDLFENWLPVVDEFRNFLLSEEADIVLEQIKDF
jgi:hypothetical protein